MDEPTRICALRLLYVGLATKSPKTGFSFTAAHKEWDRLLGRMAIRGERAISQKGDQGFEIGENDIRRYVFLENEPRNPRRKAALLALLAAHQLHSGIDGRSNRRLVQVALDATDFVTPIREYLKTKDPSTLGEQTRLLTAVQQEEPPHSAGTVGQSLGKKTISQAEVEGLVSSALRDLLKVDPDDQKNIARWLFDETDSTNIQAMKERSYYTLYRYSTHIPEIVKTFLVITSPALSGLGSFSFAHIYMSKRNRLKRIARGTLITFQRSIYFLGMSAQVRSGRGLDTLGRPKIDQPEGLKVFAIPISEAQSGFDLLPAVYMSNSLKWHPIVGRLAMVHIGFESTVGPLSDANPAVQPAILLSPEALADDLRKILALGGPQSKENPAELAKKILIKINNRPHCDRDLAGRDTAGVQRALFPEDEQPPPL